jgi:ComEC/Rec2-related protein
MTAVAFTAILIDRPALSMRGLALAGVLIVLVEPEAVLDAGFQMSFAATAALVALFETTWGRPGRSLPSPGPIIGGLQNATAAVTGVLATSFVAGAATDLLVAYHFQRLSIYGLASNLTTAPIVSFIVAPAAAIAAVAAPFGLSEFPLRVMAWGMDLVAGVGAVFAARPEAVAAFPAAPPMMLVMTLAGLAWLVVFRGPLRALGLLGLGGAVWLAATTPAPDVLVDQSARTILARTDGEGWRLIGPARGGDYARERLSGFAGIAPRRAEELPAPLACADPARACTVFVGGAPVSIGPREKPRRRGDAPAQPHDNNRPGADNSKAPQPPQKPRASTRPADCASAGLIIATRLGPPPAAAAQAPLNASARPCPPILLDPAKDGRGGVWLYRDARAPGGWRVAPARAQGFSRPWARPGARDSGE